MFPVKPQGLGVGRVRPKYLNFLLTSPFWGFYASLH